ncbi:MAG: hypothetical protein WDZ84_14090 [Rhodovibrionaceae bacterium]
MTQNTVFIHTNAKQILGAHVGAYALRRNSATPEAFAVKILERESFSFLDAKEGESFLRAGVTRVWRNDDLQSFTPLRFLPPELMGYQGRAVVTDPDVFAVGDIAPLLTRDMQGKAIMAVPRDGHNDQKGYIATSVMLLDCARLTHWNCEEQFNELFEMKRDYVSWITLQLEPRETIGFLEPEWNHFDTLNARTKLLHNTKRNTQPWKTGLPVDYTLREGRCFGILPKSWFAASRYKPHPDPRQEAFFFGLLREGLEKGVISEDLVREEMRRDHVRHDALELIDRTPPLAAMAAAE